MRPTERTRTPEPARPAERMFTTRELLLSTWDDRRKMSPADEVGFDYAKTMLELSFHNARIADPTRPSFEVAAAIAFAERKAGHPDPEAIMESVTPFPRRRRRRPAAAPA